MPPAVTYLHLALLVHDEAQPLGVVAIDGVPVNARGGGTPDVDWADHLGVPPGGRVEFIAAAPPAGATALLMTRSVDTGNGGENDPNRALVQLVAAPDAPAAAAVLPARSGPLPARATPWLGDVAPLRVRKLYFSERQLDPNDPASPTTYYITEQGKEPKAFDPSATEPDIIVHQGDVEDWIIENRSQEVHAFHIHQIHFLLLDWFGLPVNEPFLRDTVNVPYYDPKMGRYPERQAAHGFPRPGHGRHVRLPLPPARARGPRHDGHDPRPAGGPRRGTTRGAVSYSTVTLLARLRGWSTSVPLRMATW